MPDAVQAQLEGRRRREGKYRGGESGKEEKGLTDGERQIDKEKQGLAAFSDLLH